MLKSGLQTTQKGAGGGSNRFPTKGSNQNGMGCKLKISVNVSPLEQEAHAPQLLQADAISRQELLIPAAQRGVDGCIW